MCKWYSNPSNSGSEFPNSYSNSFAVIWISWYISSVSASDAQSISLSSSYTKWSSLPFIALLMQDFLKERIIISEEISDHTSFTHWEIVCTSTFFKFLAFVRDLSSVDIHSIHFCLNLSLNGLFKQASNGCNIEVSLPGITVTVVFNDRHFLLSQ